MEISDLTPESLAEAIGRRGVLLIDCWADGCRPCHLFAPAFAAAAAANPEHLFAKLNTDDWPELREALCVESLPTLLLYRDGMLMFHEPGAHSAETVGGMIEQALSVDMNEVRANIDAAARG